MQDGNFVDKQARTVMRIIANGEGCFLRHETGPRIELHSEFSGVSYASLKGNCRDSESGLDHAIVLLAGGQYGAVGFWSVDSRVNTPPTLEYEEFWPPEGMSEDERLRFVNKDGSCLWRDRKNAADLFQGALGALRVEDEPTWQLDAQATAVAMPSRQLSQETVLRWLPALETVAPSIVTLERARFVSEQDRDSWTVVQVLGNRTCDAPGVVLVLDRQKGSWRAVYDVRSGCSKSLNFPLRNMVVSGNALFAEMCYDCSFWGDYGRYRIDLRNSRATRLDRHPWEEPEPLDAEEFDRIEAAKRISDIRKELEK